MGELRTSLVVDLAGNLQRKARDFTSALGTFSTQGSRSLLNLKAAADASGRSLEMIGNRYSAILGGGTFALALRQVGQFETRLTRLGIAGKIGDQQLEALKRQLFAISQQKDIGIDPTEALSGIEQIVEKTGDLQFAQDNLKNIATLISATGAAGVDAGGLLAEFQKMGIKAPTEVAKAIDVLNVQGKEGAFTLENLAALGPRVITAYTASGRTGVQALREMGAALQVIRQGTGSSEMAASAFEATMRTLADPQKIKQLKQLTGISVFDPEKLAKGQKQLRPINELMTEIVQKTKGDVTKLGLIFDAEAMRAFNAAASEFQRTGHLDSLDRFYRVQADGTQTMEDSKRAAATYAGAMNRLAAAWGQFADSNLSGPVQSMADALNSVEPGSVQRWLNIAKNMVLLTGGLIALQKIKGIFDARSAAGAGGIGGGAPIPVYVVNGPGADVPGGAGPGAGGRSRIARLAGAAQGLATSAAVGYAVGSEIYADKFQAENGHNNSAGHAIGGTIARVLAWMGNDAAQYAVNAERELAAKGMTTKMEGQLRIVIDGPGRVADMSGKNMQMTAETGRNMEN